MTVVGMYYKNRDLEAAPQTTDEFLEFVKERKNYPYH
jgi:hypothetical protein